MAEEFVFSDGITREEISSLLECDAFTSASFRELTCGFRLGDRAIADASAFILAVCQTNIQALDLSHQALENFSLDELLTLLSPIITSSVTTLNLSNNAFITAERPNFAIAKLIKHMADSGIHTYILDNIGLGYLSANEKFEFAAAIADSKTSTLSLGRNHLNLYPDDNLEAFLGILSKGPLSELSLYLNALSTTTLIRAFKGRLLKKLDLSLNPELSRIDSHEFSLVDPLPETNIKHLLVNNCHLGAQSFAQINAFFQSLAKSYLKKIAMSDAIFPELTPEQLFMLFNHLKTLTLTSLSIPYLFEGNIMSSEHLIQLALALQPYSTLEFLDFGENTFLGLKDTPEAITTFRTWYHSLPKSLKTLKLNASQLSALGPCDEIATILSSREIEIIFDKNLPGDSALIQALSAHKKRISSDSLKSEEAKKMLQLAMQAKNEAEASHKAHANQETFSDDESSNSEDDDQSLQESRMARWQNESRKSARRTDWGLNFIASHLKHLVPTGEKSSTIKHEEQAIIEAFSYP